MTTEEKAKRYDEALERLKGLIEGTRECRCAIVEEDIIDIFPELTETEDERIRKDFCKDIWTYIPNEKAHKYIAWLEKQGEKPKKVSIWKHWTSGIAGNGEGEVIYLIKDGYTYSLSSSLGCECDYIELSELDKLMQEEKQGKSKWTEEDECCMGECISAIATKDGWSFEEKRKTKHWLNLIKQRIGE